MKQIDSSFAQTLLIIAIISAVFVVGFLWWDNTQNLNPAIPSINNRVNQTVPQLTPTPVPPKTESINSIETDFNNIDSTKYENQVDLGQTQLGTDASAL